jgi:aspartate aminotransferase
MLQSSPTPAAPALGLRPAIAGLPSSKIREIAHAGMGRADHIPLWFGEPDTPTPKFICDAAARALRRRRHFLSAQRRHPRAAPHPCRVHERSLRHPARARHLTVSASAMNALMLAMQALVDPGDVVVTTTPSWPNLPAVPLILSGELRNVPLSPGNLGWRLDLDRLFDACDGRTRVIFLNSPNNPTGGMSAEQKVLGFARERGIWIVSDEVYARIGYDRGFAPSFREHAEADDRVIVVHSFSKTWSMTGWRLGWITAPAELEPSFEKLTEYNIAGPPGFVQRAGIVAVQDGEPFVAEIVARYRATRDLVLKRVAAITRLSLPRPEAAFYAFILGDGMQDSVPFANDLLTKSGVSLAPGTAFGDGDHRFDDHLHLCFAATLPTLERAFERIDDYLASL